MKKLCVGLQAVAGVVILLVVFWAPPACSQEINLDKMERCGDLVCYQSLKEADVFYYLPDRPRLAMKNGRPQFSFLKYARVQETGEAGTGRAEGGGIVHFLVTYGADESRVRAAEAALQQTHENGRIAGPIVYRTGSFALVTSFTEGAETLTRTVAVGRAPLMEGQKAAASIALTREGAELLWESFQSSTPDISIVFDMEFAGVREPYEATLEADWQRVSQHHRVQAGGQYKWFGIDIDLLFQELRQTGAIKITTKGEHAMMDRIIESANAKLLSVMFDAAPDELTRMAEQKGTYDNLNQAVKMLKDRTAPAEKKTSTPKKKSELTFPPLPGHGVNQMVLALSRLAPGTSIAHAADQQTAGEAYQKADELYQKKNYQEAMEWLIKGMELDDNSEDEHRGQLIFNIGQC
ncbi:MAG TPA: hypothetical protein ENN79_13930, partial [Desulfobacteraceae bacterium]|nr:hypothetical protein [Desulfobacteraceae bacterium]